MESKRTSKSLADEIGKRQPFEVLEVEVFLNLARTYAQLAGDFDTLFERFGITDAQYNVLRIVRGHGRQGVPTQAIAPEMVTRGPDMTRLLDRLVSRGLVVRERCPADRRVVWVRLTEAGTALLKKLDRPVEDLHRLQLGHLGPRKLRVLNGLLFAARRSAPD